MGGWEKFFIRKELGPEGVCPWCVGVSWGLVGGLLMGADEVGGQLWFGGWQWPGQGEGCWVWM